MNDSNTVVTEPFVEAVAYLLRETFEGSPEGQPSAYLDRGVGFFSTLGKLSAPDVSREINSTTIAARPNTQNSISTVFVNSSADGLNA